MKLWGSYVEVSMWSDSGMTPVWGQKLRPCKVLHKGVKSGVTLA